MKNVLAITGSPGHWSGEEGLPYLEALRAAAIQPMVVSPGHEISLDGVSGLLLMGGTDVNPARYGEMCDPTSEEPDDLRDEAELALLADVLGRDLPVLAICRGLQILNVCLGGSLVQHLEQHRQVTKDRSLRAHEIEILPGTRLAEVAGDARRWAVNSRHHQAIKLLGVGLRVAARDPRDGTIEAVELPGRRFVLGVQWHPENLTKAPGHCRLFQAFSESLG